LQAFRPVEVIDVCLRAIIDSHLLDARFAEFNISFFFGDLGHLALLMQCIIRLVVVLALHPDVGPRRQN